MHIDYVDPVETWDSLATSLLKHGVVSTKSSGYDDPDKFIRHFQDGASNSLKKKMEHKVPIFLGWDEQNYSGSRPYIILTLQSKFATNRDAKALLDNDY